MMYDFGIDPVTKTQIVIFEFYTTKEFGVAKKVKSYSDYWMYYKYDGSWSHYLDKIKKYSTKEEAESDCKKYLNFLKECGYDI